MKGNAKNDPKTKTIPPKTGSTKAKETPGTQTTSGIALEAGFKEAKIFEVEYHLTCKCDTFNAFEGHRSYVEDLGNRRAMFAVSKENLTVDGSFDTSKVLQVVRDQILIPEFEGHEAINIQIVNVVNRSEVGMPTFTML